MTVLKLTAPNGDPVWVVAKWITSFRAAGSQGLDYASGSKTVIEVGGKTFAVKETTEEICKLMVADDE